MRMRVLSERSESKDLSSRVTPLDSALMKNMPVSPFRMNIYKKRWGHIFSAKASSVPVLALCPKESLWWHRLQSVFFTSHESVNAGARIDRVTP